jgi:hypothetical protein
LVFTIFSCHTSKTNGSEQNSPVVSATPGTYGGMCSDEDSAILFNQETEVFKEFTALKEFTTQRLRRPNPTASFQQPCRTVPTAAMH